MDRFIKHTLILAALLMVLGIGLGAFGAHGLKSKVSVEDLQTFRTGVLYHLLHALSIALVACLPLSIKNLQLGWVVRCFALGIILFSGSIYLLATADLTGISTSFLGPITPVGGLFFLLGWILLAWKCYQLQ